ncbi:EF-hand domain-containing protein [Streptomyces sp. CJ_13]|uniref:EF-hand domain-containing protein n=1 Tax=Streptomyces TaxID=1883 RepID=UPI000F3AA94B|nr:MULTISPECIES: EF-hand domain-containing protein [unclassified Streptomyces]AYV25369.1 Calerythrin [Streptomyces sp. ADI95-16]MBT1188701.1 EF-hand domain-containing protein [Streptomyces sp. CJ_13]
MSGLDDYAAKMAARFHTFDQDGDGHVTRRDFRLMAERVARAFDVADGTDRAASLLEAADRYWEGMAGLADGNLDGRITREEFVGAALAGLHQDPAAFTRIALPWHRAVFTAADHDGDRRVTVNAVDLMLVALGAEPEQARRVAAEHRTDPTGLITEDEILTAVTAYYTTGQPQQAFAVPA